MLSSNMGNIWEQYDDWKCTDTESQLAWNTIFESEWAESLVRQEFPFMSEEDVEIMAQHRIDNGYYATLDF
jgi:hypothetical protein